MSILVGPFDFTGSNGDPAPAGLTSVVGSWQIWINELRDSSTSALGIIRTDSKDGVSGAVRVTCDLKAQANPTLGAWWIVARSSLADFTAGNSVVIIGNDSLGGTIKVQEYVGGVSNTLATVSGAVTGFDGKIVLECNGTTLNCYAQRSSDSNWLKSDGSYQSGQIAFAIVTTAVNAEGYCEMSDFNVVNDTWYFDNFLVESLATVITNRANTTGFFQIF